MSVFLFNGNDIDDMVSGFRRWTRAGGSPSVERTINNTGRAFTTTGKEVFLLEFEDLDQAQFDILKSAHASAMGSSVSFTVSGSAFTCAFSTPNEFPGYEVIIEPETKSLRYRLSFTLEEL